MRLLPLASPLLERRRPSGWLKSMKENFKTKPDMPPRAEIVIFVKDQAWQTHLANLLNAAGRESVRASCLIQALRLIKELAPKLVITEIAQEGLEVLSTVNRYYPAIKVMMLAG